VKILTGCNETPFHGPFTIANRYLRVFLDLNTIIADLATMRLGNRKIFKNGWLNHGLSLPLQSDYVQINKPSPERSEAFGRAMLW
jgi:hypothetical protein